MNIEALVRVTDPDRAQDIATLRHPRNLTPSDAAGAFLRGTLIHYVLSCQPPTLDDVRDMLAVYELVTVDDYAFATWLEVAEAYRAQGAA